MEIFNQNDTAFRVCVDGVRDGRMSGSVYSRQLSGPIAFSDCGDLVLKLEDVMDVRNFPQAFQRTRRFAPRENTVPAAVEDLDDGIPAGTVAAARGRVATFMLQVLSRRNSTWQGAVDWLDGKPPEPFCSDLEFLRLMEEWLSRNS